MSGPLPPSLSSQVNLTYLRLSNNFFSGSIPSQWGQMQSLQYLYLHGNALSGQIPASLSNLSSLQRLLIQVKYSRVSCCFRLMFKRTGGQDNNLNGTIPGQLQELQQLVYLMASNNSLSGTIPAVLGNIGTLLWLTLHDNQLSGAIPEHLDQITGLQRFTCWGNPSMQRRWAPDAYQLGNIDSISVYETQVRRRPLPDLKFF